MLQKFKHIIWDWNGTLLNDVELCIEVINAMLNARNLEQIDKATYQELFQFPISAYYKKLGFDFVQEPFEMLASEYVATFDARSKNCALHSGALDILKSIKATHRGQYILSAHEHHSLTEVLEHQHLLHLFNGVYGLEDCKGESKIERGMQLINDHQLSLKDTVLIGDTNHDLDVANELGVQCLLVANGHHSFKRLKRIHGRVFRTMHDIFN